MSFVLHASFCLLILCLSPDRFAPAYESGTIGCVPLISHGLSQSSDEEAVRASVEKYAAAIAASDLEAMRELWNPQSPDRDARIMSYQTLFSNTRVEFVSPKVTRLEVMGDKAVSHLTADERRLDKKTGTISTDLDAFHGSCRSIEWIKTSAGWKIEREDSVQDEIAVRLEAAASAREATEILEKEKAFVTNALVSALTIRCLRRRLRGDFDRALRCYQTQQEISEKIGYQSGLAGASLGIGWMKLQQDDFGQTLLFQQRALALYEAGGDKLGAALTLANLSHPYHELGNYRQAFECANKSLRIYEEQRHRRGTANALTELAHVYLFQNNHQQALVCYARAFAIYQELGDKIQATITRFGIVGENVALGNYDRGLETYLELLKQTEDHGDQAGSAAILHSIGSIHFRQGRYAEAMNYYRKSLQAAESVNHNSGATETLASMGEVYLAENKYTEAEPLAERAESLSRQLGDQYFLWYALTIKGYCHLGLNRPAEARLAFAEAISIIEELRLQTAGGVEDRQRHFEQGLNTYHGMLSLLAQQNQIPEALVFAERAKARALLDTLGHEYASVQKAMTADEQERERRLKSEITQLNLRLAHAAQSDKPDAEHIDEIKTRLEKARLDYEAFQTTLYASHPDLKVQRGDAPIIKAEELTSLLPDAASAMLEYVVTDDKTYLFVIVKAPMKAGAEIRAHILPIKREELANHIEAFRLQLASRDLGFRDEARRLYDLLLKPAQAELRGKTNLIISPDDKLWDLPFQALLDGDNRYALEKSAISYAPSLTVLREMMKARRRGAETSRARLLAFGAPSLGEKTAATALRGENLDPLPEAEAEVKGLKRLYGASHSKIYTGAEAREDRAKNEAGDFKILHFATHGVLNNAAPMYSYLALAQGDKNEDGLLEAWELMRMDLRADLAVLSACETARGRFGAGEGVIGLSWAMFVAGAPATVVSQWKVESSATHELMLGFHQSLLALTGLIAPSKAKITKAEALRQSALKLMKNPGTAHPFYWAGFVLVGDGR
jgi:CHAT domain-containing protein/lipopolysaccharide biosynthesis regulator YciM